VAEGSVTLYGKAYRAVVVHSSSQDQRRQQHLQREIQASSATLEATVREATRQEYVCHADAEAAAAKLRALQSAYHWVQVDVEERPQYGPGRPSLTQPRRVKALRYGLQATLHERSEVIARKTQETGCFVLLTNVPTAGEMAHTARDVLQAYKEQHGIEQNFGFLKDPLIVNSLFLKKPERIEALGLVLLLALLLWRLVERTLRGHVETTETPLPGWDKKATHKPTAFDDDQVCGSDGHQSRAPTPAHPPTIDGPTAISPGTGCPCDLLHSSPEWLTRCGWQEQESNVPWLT
jgi:transposase